MEGIASYTFRDGGSITGPRSVVEDAAESDRMEARTEQAWLDDLQERGVKAAHPDDGWVDREANTVTFSYPRFNLRPQPGDLIALGWYGNYRIVRVTDVREWGVLTPMTTYSFVETDLS